MTGSEFTADRVFQSFTAQREPRRLDLLGAEQFEAIVGFFEEIGEFFEMVPIPQRHYHPKLGIVDHDSVWYRLVARDEKEDESLYLVDEQQRVIYRWGVADRSNVEYFDAGDLPQFDLG